MHLPTPPPPPRKENLLPVLAKIKVVYVYWYSIYHLIPKIHRYSLALKIDNLFIEIIEMTAAASFVKKQDKSIYLKTSIRKLDTLKIMLMILWETKSIDNKKYELLSIPLEEVGKMLGGWLGQTEKLNENKTTL